MNLKGYQIYCEVKKGQNEKIGIYDNKTATIYLYPAYADKEKYAREVCKELKVLVNAVELF